MENENENDKGKGKGKEKENMNLLILWLLFLILGTSFQSILNLSFRKFMVRVLDTNCGLHLTSACMACLKNIGPSIQVIVPPKKVSQHNLHKGEGALE